MTMNSYSIQFCMRFMVLFSFACALFWPTLVQMEAIWRGTDTYMHCYFIVPMSLYMIWKQKNEWSGLKPEPALLPALLMIPILTLWLSAYAIDVGFVSHIAQVVFFQLLIWHLLGHKISKIIRFPLFFLIFSAPFGESLTPALQEITADMSVVLLRIADIPVYREGLYLHTPVSIFEVAEACSGLNFLISSAVIALLFSFLYFQQLRKQVIFLLFVLVLAIVANGIRAFLLIYVGEKTNMAWGFGADHYYYGWAVFAITMLISFRIGEQFADATESNQARLQTDIAAATNENHQSQFHKVHILTLAFILLFFPLRIFLPVTNTPDTPTAVISLDDFIPLENNRLGTTFHDGLRRSALVNEEGVEFVAADYAVRQARGDLITWHNWVFDPKHWTILDRETSGTVLNNVQYLHLTNIKGQRITVLYWYQVGEVRTSMKVVAKLLQLQAILFHTGVESGVRVYSVPNAEFELGKQELTFYRDLNQ